MSTTHEEPFTPNDLKSSILRVIGTAHTQGLIDTHEVFCLGMTQHDQENWEDGDYVVQHIDWLTSQEKGKTLSREALKAILSAVADYWHEDAESKADAACDYSGPEVI